MPDTQQTHDPQNVQLTLTEAQAQAVTTALDFYMGIGMGQIEEVAELMRNDTLPKFRPNLLVGERQPVPPDTLAEIEVYLNDIKALLGYPSNSHHGIGHPDNHPSVTRSYEIMKAMRKTLAVARDPSPTYHTVDYDGVTVRYTNDPAPACRILSLSTEPST